jgi:hypothetical protein
VELAALPGDGPKDGLPGRRHARMIVTDDIGEGVTKAKV